MEINLEDGVLVAEPNELNPPVYDENSNYEETPVSDYDPQNLTGQHINLQTSDKPAQNVQYVPKKDFDALQANVAAVQENIAVPLDLSVGYVSAATAVIAVVEFVALIIVFSMLSNAGSKIRQLGSDLRTQNKDEKELSRKIALLESEIYLLKNEGENQKRLNEQKNFDFQSVNKFPQQPQTPLDTSYAPPSSPPPPPPEKFKAFVDDFNKLVQQISTIGDPFEAKKISNEFMHRYQIKDFSCSNFEARVSEPVPPPQFNISKNGDFWAYEYEPGTFAVVPSITVRNYRDNYHNQRAMGDVFDSNFETSKTYNKIFVNRPAIFKGMWNLSKKGNLELS